MRFEKATRYEYQATARKSAAILRKQQKERDALPLFADLVAADQKPVDQVHAIRAAAAVRSQIEERAYRCEQWRRARRLVDGLPPADRELILRRWNLSRWWPGTPVYLLSMLHMHKTGRLEPVTPNMLYPDRATRNRIEAERMAMLHHRAAA